MQIICFVIIKSDKLQIRWRDKVMFKKSFMILLLLMVAPVTAYAHTGLKSSVPAQDEVVATATKEITMEFNTEIESLSTVEVVDAKGEKVKVSEVQVKSPMMVAKFETDLPNGVYTANWKIIGKDGHPVAGKYSFTVQLPATPAPTPTPTISPTMTPLPTVTPVPTPTPTNVQAASTGSAESNSYVPAIIIGLVVVGVVAFILRRMKTNKK